MLYYSAVAESIQGITHREIATEELNTLLDVSEVIYAQVAIYGVFEELALRQHTVKSPNPELFMQIQTKLDRLREVWGEHYELIARSVVAGNLDWSKVGRESRDDFSYTLLVNGEPAIRFIRSDIYDGDIEVFNLKT